MYNPVIFDLDGTLLNTLGDLAAAGNYALSQMGFPTHEVNKYRYFVGNGVPKLIERILPENHTETDFNTAYRLFGEYYELHKTDSTKPYDGISELLETLTARGITCLCNSNKSHSFSCELLKGFFGDKLTEIVGGEHGFPKKPAPDAALYLAEKYKKDGFSPLYVGDSSVDMQTAANAGFDACGVLWGFRDRAELEQFHPKFLAENVGELRKIILGEQNED